ncbi:MAG: AbrB/MazE/SpoVT family DNA-binding domain-containing protein [Halobaculum sp.]
MATEEMPAETLVSDDGTVVLPSSLKQELDIEPGDRLRWRPDGDGGVTVEVIHQQYGVFEDFEPASMGGGGTETHDLAGREDSD